MAKLSKLVAGATVATGLLGLTPATAGTVITQAVYNASDPGHAFTPADPFGTILNTPLYETVSTKKKPILGDLCTVAGKCTYDFTFSLSGIPKGSTTQIQLQAAAQTLKGSTPEILDYDLFKGTPGSTTFTPITSLNFIAASGPAGTVGQVISANLGNGAYYVQIMPSAVKVSGEIGSGSITETAVPEPMAWLLMLTGFGSVGVALRHRAARPASVACATPL